MGFQIAQGSPQSIWCPVVNTDTLYVGQLVRCINEGVAPLAVASGLADQAHKMAAVALISDGSSANNQLFGVVIGTNRRSPLHSTTYNAEYITYVAPSSATAEDYFGVEGPWAKGDRQAMVKVALITGETVLRGPLFDTTFGVALTTAAITSGASTTGATTTTAITVAPPLASMSTGYFKSGAAAGSYRIWKTTSTTVHTWDLPLTSTCAVDDVITHITGLRPIGLSFAQFDTECMFIDANAALSTNYFLIDVVRLDLSDEKNAWVEFRMSSYSMLSYDDVE